MGGHGHGDHHGAPYEIPDYRIYKVEDVPKLLNTQRALAQHGLKDPWLRNEVWRFQNIGTPAQRAKIFFFRGFGVGCAALAVTIIGTAAYDYAFPSEHGHGNGDHH